MSGNTLYKSLIMDGAAVLCVMDTTGIVRDGMRIHSLTGADAELFGGYLTFGAYLGSTLKSDVGSLSVSLTNDGGDSVSVSCSGLLHVRGYMNGGAESLSGPGTLTVISEDGYGKLPFAGICRVGGGDISGNLTEYFFQSAQTPTVVRIECVVDGDRCVSAGGVVISLMPGAPEHAYQTLSADLYAIGDLSAEIAKGASLFADARFGGEPLDMLEPEYRCDCTRARIARVLDAMEDDDLRDLCEERGCVSVHCHYCNADYVFDRDEIEEMLAARRQENG